MKRTDIPANISLMVPTKERLAGTKPTRVLDIFDGGSTNFHEEGLFSISTFGRTGSDERDTRFSYIDIKTEILHPYVYKQLLRLRGLYGEIMSSKAYVVWDETINDFVPSDPMHGETGYQLFMSKWKQIVFKGTGSDIRDLRIKFITKFKESSTTDKIMVIPAGLRDVQIDGDGRIKEGEINEFYRSLISISNTINPNAGPATKILDNSRYSLQLTFLKIYEYIIGLLEGKGGFLQDKWGARRIFNGTRNVLTAMDTSPAVLGELNSPKINQTGIGLYQLMRGALPKTKHALMTGWLTQVFSGKEGEALLVNPKTLHREYVKINADTIDKWSTTSGLERVINSYKEVYVRLKPVLIEGYYIGLVYRGPDLTFKFFNDIDDLPKGLDPKHVHPITLCELMYVAGYRLWNTLGMFVTRYPVTGVGSIYASFAYVKNTVKGEVRRELGHDWLPMGDDYTAIEYPTFIEPVFVDSLIPHVSRLKLLAADFDGDTASANIVYTDEAIAEIHTLLGKPNAYLNPRGGFFASPMVDTVERVLFNMTGD